MLPHPIEPAILAELIRFDPETGLLFWLERAEKYCANRQSFLAWNTKYAGREALTSNQGSGYRYGSIFNKHYLAHRVVWALSHGEWPNLIDHINGDTLDNRLTNLRSVTASQNSRNMRLRSDSTSGYPGVSKPKRSRGWTVGITVNGRWSHVGTFATRDEAIAARKAIEPQHGYHANHGRRA